MRLRQTKTYLAMDIRDTLRKFCRESMYLNMLNMAEAAAAGIPDFPKRWWNEFNMPCRVTYDSHYVCSTVLLVDTTESHLIKSDAEISHISYM